MDWSPKNKSGFFLSVAPRGLKRVVFEDGCSGGWSGSKSRANEGQCSEEPRHSTGRQLQRVGDASRQGRCRGQWDMQETEKAGSPFLKYKQYHAATWPVTCFCLPAMPWQARRLDAKAYLSLGDALVYPLLQTSWALCSNPRSPCFWRRLDTARAWRGLPLAGSDPWRHLLVSAATPPVRLGPHQPRCRRA